MSRDGKAAGKQTNKVQSKGRSIAEWTTFILSGIILLFFIGLATYQYIARGTNPTTIETIAIMDKAYQHKGVYYVPISIRNTGEQTAEAVRVQVIFQMEGGKQESSEVEIQFLAGGETAKAVVAFSNDPRQGEIKTDTISFLTP